MATIKLFGNLRKIAGLSTIELSGEDVGQLLEALCSENDALREAIFDGAALKSYVRVVINGRDIELDQGVDTEVSESSSVAVFPPIAGGCRARFHFAAE